MGEQDYRQVTSGFEGIYSWTNFVACKHLPTISFNFQGEQTGCCMLIPCMCSWYLISWNDGVYHCENLEISTPGKRTVSFSFWLPEISKWVHSTFMYITYGTHDPFIQFKSIYKWVLYPANSQASKVSPLMATWMLGCSSQSRLGADKGAQPVADGAADSVWWMSFTENIATTSLKDGILT